mmetsp:Transcript_137609/g.343445  ORF Transcript_137609/g.343445 Transcript_137609/m.343445 type:complete len:208 (+) Transcript_137609:327-950(+)
MEVPQKPGQRRQASPCRAPQGASTTCGTAKARARRRSPRRRWRRSAAGRATASRCRATGPPSGAAPVSPRARRASLTTTTAWRTNAAVAWSSGGRRLPQQQHSLLARRPTGGSSRRMAPSASAQRRVRRQRCWGKGENATSCGPRAAAIGFGWRRSLATSESAAAAPMVGRTCSWCRPSSRFRMVCAPTSVGTQLGRRTLASWRHLP